MGVREYEQTLTTPLKEATVLLLLKGDEVLLAMKKRGFGVGKWNGVGGKPNPNEDIKSTAIRESQEEIGITPSNLKNVAVFKYHFPHNNFGMKVWVFTTTEWHGEPVETEEMRPKWFKLEEIPFKEMWVDDEVWMPKVFAGKLLTGSFMFGENDSIDDYYITEVQSLD